MEESELGAGCGCAGDEDVVGWLVWVRIGVGV